jgi:uncharacterized alkaline shock family protein YloU
MANNEERYEEIIASIVVSTVSQIEGVADLSLDSGATFSGKLFRSTANSVQVTLVSSTQVVVDICIKAYYGTRVPELAYAIQSAVQEKVKNSTPYQVSNVNVHVVGVVFK